MCVGTKVLLKLEFSLWKQMCQRKVGDTFVTETRKHLHQLLSHHKIDYFSVQPAMVAHPEFILLISYQIEARGLATLHISQRRAAIGQ